MINIEDFDKVEMRAGTIIDVKDNKKSRNPAYVVTIDFGEELGVKKSSAQITNLYQPEDLIGTQVICCVNLTPMHIGSVKSEVRILGTDSEQGVVLLATENVGTGVPAIASDPVDGLLAERLLRQGAAAVPDAVRAEAGDDPARAWAARRRCSAPRVLAPSSISGDFRVASTMRAR